MSPYALENLHQRLGRPAWFWPLVFLALLALVLLGSSISPEQFE